MLSLERATELLQYDPVTGDVRWLDNMRKGQKAGSVHDKRGYLVVYIDGHRYYLHRVVFLLMTGKWPKDQVDHQNLDKSDLRWENLREATCSQNFANRKAYKNNKSGYKGVSWCKIMNKWAAEIRINRKGQKLGYFDDPKDAHAAYCAAASRIFGEFARAA